VPNLSPQRYDPSLVALGASIRRVRMELGISQEKLALVAEVDRSYLGRVERGDNNVAMLTLVKIAQGLNTTVSRLVIDANL
jgi:transcriptional regulator with XRE-family HTH domain